MALRTARKSARGGRSGDACLQQRMTEVLLERACHLSAVVCPCLTVYRTPGSWSLARAFSSDLTRLPRFQ